MIHATYTLSDGQVVTRREAAEVEPPPLAVLAENFAAVLRAKELEVAREYAEQACDEYTKWCNGDCWGRCIEYFTPKGEKRGLADDDSYVWGFVGGNYADDALKEEFEAHRQYHNKEYADTRPKPRTRKRKVCTTKSCPTPK